MKKIAKYVIFLLFFFLTASGNIDSIDATTHAYLARQIVTQGKINFGRNLLLPELVARTNNKTGNYYPIYNFGYALLLIPGVAASLAAHTLLHVNSSSFPAAPDWILAWYMNMFNPIVLILIWITLKRLVKLLAGRRAPPKHIDLILLMGIFTSNLVIQGHEHFVHLLFSLFACLSFEQLFWYAKNDNRRHLLLFSVWFAATAAAYNTSFAFLIPPLIVFYFLLTKGKTSLVKRLLYLGATFIPAFSVQAVWDCLRYGNPLLTGYHGRTDLYAFNIVEILKHVYGMTIGPNKGLFIYSPFLWLSLWFCMKAYRKAEKTMKCFILFLLVLFAAYLLAYTPISFWHGDSAYGPRYLTPIVVFGLIPFVFFMDGLKEMRLKVLSILILGFGIIVQIPGMLIPNFTYRFITKPGCVQSERWYYDPRCTPFAIGWAHLIKRESKAILFIFQNGPLITDRYPNPLKPFKTIYPDPLFDAFSRYKVGDFKVSPDLLNNIYAFSPDLWWVKLQYYKNILP